MIDIRMRRCVSFVLAMLLTAGATMAVAQPPSGDLERVPDDPANVEPELEPYRYRAPVFRIGGNHSLNEGDEAQAIVVVMGDGRIAGHVRSDVFVMFGKAEIASTAVIEGSLVVVGGHASITGNPRVGRGFFVLGGSVDADPGFTPDGEHVVVDPRAFGVDVDAIVPWITRGLLWGRPLVPSLRWLWLVVGAFLLAYVVLTLVLERPVRRAADTIAVKPVSTFLTGLLVLLLIGPIGLLLAATVIGVIVVPFAVCGLLAAWLIGKAGVLRWLGMRMVPEPRDADGVAPRSAALRSLILGAAVVTVAYTIPIVGLLTWGIGGIMALGTAVLTIRDGYRRENPDSPRVFVRRRAAPAAPASVVTEPIVPSPQSARSATAMPEPRLTTTMPYQADVGAGTAYAEVPPMPEPSPLSGFPLASFRDRLAAFALDLIVVVIAARALDLLYPPADRRFVLLLVLYHIAFWATKGTTVGGMICNLRVIKLDGQPLRPAEALVRGVAGVLSGAVAGLGFLWMLKEPHRETWHDKIAGTQVVKVPRNYPF